MEDGQKKVREAIEDFKKLAELLQNKESVAVEHCNTSNRSTGKAIAGESGYKRGF